MYRILSLAALLAIGGCPPADPPAPSPLELPELPNIKLQAPVATPFPAGLYSGDVTSTTMMYVNGSAVDTPEQIHQTTVQILADGTMLDTAGGGQLAIGQVTRETQGETESWQIVTNIVVGGSKIVATSELAVLDNGVPPVLLQGSGQDVWEKAEEGIRISTQFSLAGTSSDGSAWSIQVRRAGTLKP